MAKISMIEPKTPALKKRQKVAAYARVSMDDLSYSQLNYILRNWRTEVLSAIFMEGR